MKVGLKNKIKWLKTILRCIFNGGLDFKPKYKISEHHIILLMQLNYLE